MERITDKHLEAVCKRINITLGMPLEPYSKGADGRNVANVGNFHISHAYGGVNLERMYNKDGGISCPLTGGHITKRDLYNRMHAYLSGIEAGKAE
jgi:hypothetical protein